MFYLVIDLEMCRVPRDYRNKAYHYAYETIQIGAVLLKMWLPQSHWLWTGGSGSQKLDIIVYLWHGDMEI